MKKQLLLGSALLAAISAFPQNGRVRPKASALNMAEVIAAKFTVNESAAPSKLNIPAQGNVQAEETAKTASPLVATSINWKLLGGAMNVYGVLVSQSRPLQYNDNLNAISFIHRKSDTYVANPSSESNSGTVVAEISTDWGATFDSTCIWASSTNLGRYPQGAIYSAPGNTNIANAYVVASGPIVSGSAFTGNWYASKQLGVPGSTVYNTTPDMAPNGQQYVPFNLTTYPPNFSAHSWPRVGFSATDDGMVRALAMIQNDNSTINPRGVGVVKGVFNAGVFNWTMDSIIPNALLDGVGDKNIGEGQMAWNESGTVGYVLIPGTLASATLNNVGFQPIVYKTTNSGVSWAPIAPIDFNSATMQPIVNHLYTIGGTFTNVTVPYMLDWDITVDGNNNLHIGAIFCSGASNHPDSIRYIQQFTVGTDVYKYSHTPGDRPYLYDFVGDGTSPWTWARIDSLPTEDPGAQTTSPGYAENPWDATGGGSAKMNIDPRVQLGRTPDGQFISYSWSESDTAFTNGGKKYNTLPNIKTRLSAISAGTSTINLSSTEINATKYPASQGANNPQVNSRATFHYMSPTTGAATIITAGSSTVDVFTPLTVTNSNPYTQLANNTIWFSNARMSYFFPGPVGIENNTSASVLNSVIYPNPAKNSAVLSVDLKNSSNVSVSVYNTIGQLVKATNAEGQVGENNINIDLTNLTTGVYIVNVKVGNTTTTKKLIVE